MSIIERIDQDLKEAMKAKNETAISSLRMVRSAFKNKQIDLGHELSQEDATAALRSMLKQYRDALADFTAAGRTDLAERQTTEIELLERYLPASISESEIETIAREVITSSDAKDFGRIMGEVVKRVGGRADGGAVRVVVERLLK